MRARSLICCILATAACAPTDAELTQTVDATSFVDKITAGYQAWFSCPSPRDGGGWFHWSPGTTPRPGRVNFELYPNVSEYDPGDLCDTDLGPLGNGQPARLYNSIGASVIDTHFRWMAEYGIDGVGVQRFVVGLSNPSFSHEHMRRIRAAAERHGRIYYVMYDITGASSGWANQIKNDWVNLVETGEAHRSSPQYAHQDGRPVVNVWGLGGGTGSVEQSLESDPVVQGAGRLRRRRRAVLVAHHGRRLGPGLRRARPRAAVVGRNLRQRRRCRRPLRGARTRRPRAHSLARAGVPARDLAGLRVVQLERAAAERHPASRRSLPVAPGVSGSAARHRRVLRDVRRVRRGHRAGQGRGRREPGADQPVLPHPRRRR